MHLAESLVALPTVSRSVGLGVPPLPLGTTTSPSRFTSVGGLFFGKLGIL
jgi:hypothetical protein